MAKAKLTGLGKLKANLEEQLRGYTRELGNEIANELADDMVKRYEEIVDTFYEEYTPKVYRRHNPRGLEKTYRRHKSAPHGVYYGGIEITDRYMYSDYRQDHKYVLESFISGYHGPVYMGLKSYNTEPWEQLQKYKESQKTNISSYIDTARNKVESNNKYSMLKF